MIELAFLGAADTVTGSRYLLTRRGERLLVDCGLFQGLKRLRLRNRVPFPVPPSEIDGVVLTHAHLDHSGYLPALVRDGYRGRIRATPATCDLLRTLLPDSGHLQEEEANRANRHGYSRHHPALPLYTEADAEATLARLEPLPFGREGAVRAFAFELRRAGHILGAASATVRSEGLEVVFSGDLGRPHDPLMWPPEPVAEADYLVVESTYGDREHPARDPAAALGDVVRRTAARGGVVVIPSFAVGRAQAILYYLHDLKRRGDIPDVPVFLDSPMAADVSALYRTHADDHRLSPEAWAEALRGATIANTVEQSKAIDARVGPMVVLSASGMATGGRVLFHLERFAPDDRNTVLLVGHQAEGTRGDALLQGARRLKIHGRWVPVRAEVDEVQGLSAHADASEILDWLRGFTRPPRTTFVTHGEPRSADALRRRIEEELGWRVHVPEHGEHVALE